MNFKKKFCQKDVFEGKMFKCEKFKKYYISNGISFGSVIKGKIHAYMQQQ